MKWLILLFSLMCFTLAGGANAQPMEVGERYELMLEHNNEYTESDGSSGSSFGRDTITVRLVAKRDGGQELEYGLPDDANDRARLRHWQLPVRVFVAGDGTVTLLNRAELEARRDKFLEAAKLPAEACGHWIMTWNAFKIECDPQSVIDMVAGFELQPRSYGDGVQISLQGASGSVAMQCTPADGGRSICTATLPVDVEAARAGLAEADVAIGEMTGKPVSLADALAARRTTEISGTIETIFDAGVDGVVIKRTTISKVRVREADGMTKVSTSRSVLTRRKI